MIPRFDVTTDRTEAPALAHARAPLWRRILIGLGVAAAFAPWPMVIFVLATGLPPAQSEEERRSQTQEAVEDALKTARLAVEEALEYQRTRGRNPGSIARLNQGIPAAAIDETDPWGRGWIASPAFRDTQTPPNPAELWVCSRGPEGRGACPSAVPSSPGQSSEWSLGYSRRAGNWVGAKVQTWARGKWLLTLGAHVLWALVILALVGYLVGYPVLRLVSLIVRELSRERQAPAPRTASWAPLNCLWGVAFVGFIVAVFIPLYQNVGARPSYARASADVRALASAVSVYHAETGELPASLADLTLETTDARGRKAGPFLTHIPHPPPGYSRYRYVRVDGTYSITSSAEKTGESVKAP